MSYHFPENGNVLAYHHVLERLLEVCHTSDDLLSGSAPIGGRRRQELWPFDSTRGERDAYLNHDACNRFHSGSPQSFPKGPQAG
jgi:hypothetical protein